MSNTQNKSPRKGLQPIKSNVATSNKTEIIQKSDKTIMKLII